MKKIIAILMSMTLAVSMLAACGTKTETTEETHSELEGKYVVVAECLANIWSYAVDGGFELMADGAATYSSYGADYDAKWEEIDGNIKISYGSEEKIVEPYAEQKGAYVIKDSEETFTIYAKEDSPAADPMLYMPENEKNMIGTWKSDAVEDLFGDDKSDEIPADALIVEIMTDHTAHVLYNGEDLGINEWFMLDGWGGVNSEEPKYTVAWNIKEDGVFFDVVKDDKMYTFHGVKQ